MIPQDFYLGAAGIRLALRRRTARAAHEAGGYDACTREPETLNEVAAR